MGAAPLTFQCPKYRALYWRTRTSGDRAAHRVTLTGRKRRRSTPNSGNSRKSDVDREYRCACGHVGWSCHIDLERMEQRQ